MAAAYSGQGPAPVYYKVGGQAEPSAFGFQRGGPAVNPRGRQAPPPFSGSSGQAIAGPYGGNTARAHGLPQARRPQ